MRISLQQFTLSNIQSLLAAPFFRLVLTAGLLLSLSLSWQIYRYLNATPAISASGEVVTIELRTVAGRWQWSPDRISAPSGALVKMRIYNEDPFTHGFAIAELGLDQRIPGLTSTEFEFVVSVPPGEYDFFCSVFCGAGHFGQRGVLTVTLSNNLAGESSATAPNTASDRSNIPIRSRVDAIATLPYTIAADGRKEFHLTTEEVMWDYGDGNPIYSWGYLGQLPGPDIRVVEGDQIRVIVTNKLPEPTTVHWHGVDIEWSADGVPGVTMNPIKPDETYVYEFTAKPAGTRIYHTHGSHHGDEAKQMDMGLAGALIIEPKNWDELKPDNDITWVLTERITSGLFAIHGAVFPTVPKITVREGEKTRVRLINAGSSTIHPMHLHGHQFRVVAVDGNPINEAAQWVRNTHPVLPGETYDIEFVADNPGHWLFHCHELQHAKGGMIAEVVYEGFVAPHFEHGHGPPKP